MLLESIIVFPTRHSSSQAVKEKMKSFMQFVAKWGCAGFLFVMGGALALFLLGFLPGTQPFENWFLPLSGSETRNQPSTNSGPNQPLPASPLPPGPTPGGDLPTISMWMTFAEDPTGERLTQVSRGRIEELHVWAESDQDRSVSFTIWMISPMGTNQWGPEFQTSSDRSPFSVGGFGPGSGMQAGDYRLEARIGDQKVGGVDFEVTE